MKSFAMHKPSLRPLLGALTLTFMVTVPMQSSAQTTIPDGVQRELNIMEEIFSASTRDRNNRGNHISPSDSLYLPGQGMLFIFNLPGDGLSGFFNGNNNYSYNFNGNFDFDFDFDSDDDGNHTVRIAPPAVPASPAARATPKGNQSSNTAQSFRDKLQNLSEQMRDKQADMRDLQRKQRELTRTQRNDSTKSSQAEIDKLNKSMEKLGEELSKLGNNINEAQKQYQQERNAEAETRSKQQTAVIFDTLCKYGRTLQSLGNNEHVSLVLRNYAGNNRTRIFVMEAAAIKNCTAADKLQQDARSYVSSHD